MIFNTYNSYISFGPSGQDAKRGIANVVSKNIGVRYTHRLSFAERARRIDFVKHKQVQTLVYKLVITDGFTTERLMANANVAYNRGKIRVNNLANAANVFNTVPTLVHFGAMFKVFWDFSVQMRLLMKIMKNYRLIFGNNCFETRKIVLTKKGWDILNAGLLFGKNFNDLTKKRKGTATFMKDRARLEAFMETSLAWKHLVDSFFEICQFLDWLRGNPGVIHFGTTDWHIHQLVLNRIPSLDGHMLGWRKLTPIMAARMTGRKARFYGCTQFYLLYDKPALKRDYWFASDLKLSSGISIFNVATWSPYVRRIDRSSVGKPTLLKFVAPSVVQDWQHISINDDSPFKVSDLVAKLNSAYYKRTNPGQWARLQRKAQLFSERQQLIQVQKAKVFTHHKRVAYEDLDAYMDAGMFTGFNFDV